MDQPLDTRTLFVVTAAIGAVLALGQWVQWKSSRSVPGAGHWAFMNASLFVAFALLGARDLVPDLVSVVGANMIGVVGVWIGLEGVRRYVGHARRERRRRVELALLAGVACTQVALTYALPSYRARVVLISLVLAVEAGAIVWTLARGCPSETRVVRYATASCFAAVGGVLLLRGLHFIVSAVHEPGLLASSYWQTVMLMVTAMSAIGWTLGFVLLGAQRVELELRRAKAAVELLAATDPLTGILNRRAFLEQAERELARASRHGDALAVIQLDLDHFKAVNDTHGHSVGDQVLVATVERIAEQMREHEIFGRLGGEEFAIIVPRADEEAATHLAERLRESLRASPIPTLAGPVELSASFGISALSPARSSVEALLRAADEALYRAKAAGRNRIEVAASVPPASAPRAVDRAPRSREKAG